MVNLEILRLNGIDIMELKGLENLTKLRILNLNSNTETNFRTQMGKPTGKLRARDFVKFCQKSS